MNMNGCMHRDKELKHMAGKVLFNMLTDKRSYMGGNMAKRDRQAQSENR